MRIPGSRRLAATITNGPDDRTVAWVGALDVRLGLTAAGLLGHRLVGMHGDPGMSWRGDLGHLQNFRGWAGGPPRGLMPGASMSLPLTGAPDPASGVFKAGR